MAEPWLDSLSEDWNSQPRSSPSLLPDASLPSSAKSLSHSRSRIPRRSGYTAVTSPTTSLRKAHSAPLQTKSILTERSKSDINISRHSSRRLRGNKSSTSPQSNSSAPSSTDSVVRQGTIDKKAIASSPTRSPEEVCPSDWKVLVMKGNNGQAAHQDLFGAGPLGLEEVFRQPEPSAMDESFESPKRSSLPSFDLESMPSSPPPWPKNYRGSKASMRTKSNLNLVESLGVVPEQEEYESDMDIRQIEGDLAHHTNVSRNDDGAMENESSEYEYQDRDAICPQVNNSVDILDDRAAIQRSADRRNPVTYAEQSDRSSHNVMSDQLSSQRGSSSNTGFSPVFISKHNTIDGGVNYAAIDTANAEAINRMREAALSPSQQHQLQEHEEALYEHDMQSARQLRENLERECSEPGEISRFVNVARGGYSDDGSFRHRPLSPSASSSIVPSDSVSQANAEHPNRSPVASRLERESGKETEQPVSLSSTLDNRQLNPSQKSPVERTGKPHLFAEPVKPSSPNKSGISSAQCMLPAGHDDILDHNFENEPKDTRTDRVASRNGTNSGSVDTVIKHVEPDRDSTNADVCLSQDLGGDFSSPKSLTSPLMAPSPELLENPTLQKELQECETRVPDPERSAQDHIRKSQILIGKKRKDARYDDNGNVPNPDEIAKREILRPRNASSSQSQLDALHAESFLRSLLSDRADEDIVREQLETTELSYRSNDSAQVQALASQVATLRVKAVDSETGDFRKQSLSTQDYIDEATKIMELIRSKRKPENDLSSVKEFESDTAVPQSFSGGNLTPQTISRPPSREGGRSGWRTKEDYQIDSNVLDHLKKYQECGNESILTSAFLSLDLANEHNVQHSTTQDTTSVISSASNPREGGRKRSYSDSDVGVIAMNEVAHTQVETQGTTHSRGSSDQTTKSVSSSKYRTMAVIGPDKVSHLIGAEQAGMKYDQEQRRWVRSKSATLSHTAAEQLSSSMGTIEDPLRHIPDLSINEAANARSTHTPIFQGREGGNGVLHLPLDENSEIMQSKHDDEFSAIDRAQETAEDAIYAARAPSSPTSELKISQLETAQQPFSHNPDLHDSYLHDPIEFESEKDAVEESETEEIEDLADRYSNCPQRMLRRNKRHEISVVFSSPPVSKEWAAQAWSDSSELDKSDFEDRVSADANDANSALNDVLNTSSIVSHQRLNNTGKPRMKNTSVDRSLSLSRIDEHHELSYVETRADGRSWSLSLNFSTPLPARRHQSASGIANSGLRNSWLPNSLSPLSEFSLHQDDSGHLKSRILADASQPLAIVGNQPRSAIVANNLVEKLTDVEPDEPYWDWMRAVNLGSKRLESLYSLDQFCPRLEELDVANNRLTLLSGAPSTVRHLNASGNNLTGTSSWENLPNLQYLDVSNNEIDTLEAMEDLLHLRELKLDYNSIKTLTGILDLDGLLELSLRGNNIHEIDFAGTELRRLSNIDLSENSIKMIRGLDYLPKLTELDLSRNRVLKFSSREASRYPCTQLRSLDLSENGLEALDVSEFHNLNILRADGNRLSSLHGISKLQQLHTLSLRDQKVATNQPAPAIESALNDFTEVQNLYLSGNTLRSLPIVEPFFNLRVLELAFTGLTSLPSNFGVLAPNLRTLNLNFNALKDLRPLRGIVKLTKLFVAGNRLHRLRRTMGVIQRLTYLTELDLRENPFSVGFYAIPTSIENAQNLMKGDDSAQSNVSSFGRDTEKLQHLLLRNPAEVDIQHLLRLDEDTKLRRRVYELLLAMKCKQLGELDGLEFRRMAILRKDELWDKLMACGAVERIDTSLPCA